MSEQVKLLLTYDISAGQERAYRRFVMDEFLPKAQELGLLPTDAWSTAYGNYPARLLGFVSDDLAAMRRVRASREWQGLIGRLGGFTRNLSQRVVPFSGGFQW